MQWSDALEPGGLSSQSSVLNVHKPALLVSGVTGGMPVHVQLLPQSGLNDCPPLPSLWSEPISHRPGWASGSRILPWHCDWSSGQEH